MEAGDESWIVVLEDRHQDVSVDVYATKDGALAGALELVESYNADHDGAYPLERTEHGEETVTWYRDDGPHIELTRKVVQP